MPNGKWSETEPSVHIESVDDLGRFIDFAETKADVPTAISVEVHGYRVDFLVGYEKSFIHMTPDNPKQPCLATLGGPAEGGVDFWLHSWHHTWCENRHLVDKAVARDALRIFFESARLAPSVEWEEYYA